MTREQSAADAMDRIGKVLDDFYRGGKYFAPDVVFAVTNIRAEYELTK